MTDQLGSKHGDPYVFPAGFAEFEHFKEEFFPPNTEYWLEWSQQDFPTSRS